jgi:hypothetical protein
MDKPYEDRGYLGISFSGGGYRATAFSLGAMALLQDLELLGRARVMSSVSGGSLALAAYLCAKAGAAPRQESEFRFYQRFWDPLMLSFENERFAGAFVRLPLLPQGEKVVLHAADSTQAFLSSLLGADACLGSEAITEMLRKRTVSPDYVFFNAANITSLDLFRFGIQRAASASEKGDGDAADPVYVLNRYFLRPGDDSLEASKLHDHARHLRLGDCVAASFAFPGGFEPLIFPYDYYRPDHCPAGPEAAQEACLHFSRSLVCDRKPYVAFLDGGLYDNLGLASVEDIRRFLARRTRKLQRQRECEGSNKQLSIEREQPIHYVIATDVDNIQPGIGFYSEPSLDRLLASSCEGELGGMPPSGGSRRRQRPLAATLTSWIRPWSLLLVVGVGLVLAALIAPLFMGEIAIHPPLLVALLAGALLIALALLLALTRLGRGLLRRGRQLIQRHGARGRGESREPADPSWTVRLGLGQEFDRQGIDNDPGHLLARFVIGWLRSPDRRSSLDTLKTATLERRIGQLLPAFNGYLKRTRSLTYGYLQQTYAQGTGPDRCHLIRNMIFELIPGAEVDPAYAADLITLPVKDYRRQALIEPMAPLIRKLRHADYIRDLIDHLTPLRSPLPASARPVSRRRMQLPRQLIECDEQLLRILGDLHLNRAASLWTWLSENLEMDARGTPGGAPNPSIGRLVEQVRDVLRVAKRDAAHRQPGVAGPMLQQRCLVKLAEDATSYSWIPMICEMATNLNTTLWVKSFHWYVPNRLDGLRVVTTGGWHPLPPPLPGPDLPVLDLSSLAAPAARITALAGYLNTCFNLLEFLYASLGASTPARDTLVEIIIATPSLWRDEIWLEELVELPYALRQATHRLLFKESRCEGGRISAGDLSLLEPRLLSREGFPEPWRDSARGWAE